MRVSIVCAMTKNRIIGAKNGLPWYLPEDLKKFKNLTNGHPIVMGRKTFESLPKVLPGRTHYVITRRKDYKRTNEKARSSDQVFVCDTPQSALDMAKSGNSPNLVEPMKSDEVFVIGGGEIFSQMLPLTDRLYITILNDEFEGDTIFPYIDPETWAETEREKHERFDFVIYDRAYVRK